MLTSLKSSFAAVAVPLLGLALALGLLAYSVIRVAHGPHAEWAGVAASLLLVVLQIWDLRRSGRPTPPPKKPRVGQRSDAEVYGVLAAVAVTLGTLAFAPPLLEGGLPIAVAKLVGAVAAALGLGWGALRGVASLPFRTARRIGLATAAAVIVLMLAALR